MNSLEYWRKREDEARQKNKKTEEQLRKETGERIEYMLNQMNKEIARFYSKYANDEDISISEAKKRVSQLDIDEYARKAKKYVKEKDFSDEANAEMKLYNLTMKINRLELLKANLGLETVDCFNDLQKYYEDALTEESLKEFQRMSGILGKTVLNNGQQARELANTSFQNATFSQRIWGHSAIFRDEVSKLLTQGLTAGINSMELARRLRKTVDSTKHQAETLMVTEMSRVRSGAQLISIEENGYDSYVFVSDPIEGAGHACHVCKSLDGKIFKVKDGRAGENMPPMHPWCRCSIAASFSEDDDTLYDEWLDGYKEHGLTFEEYAKLSNEYSDGIIEKYKKMIKLRNEYDFKNMSKEAKEIVLESDITKKMNKINKLLDKYFDIPSNWSGKVTVEKMNKYGCYDAKTHNIKLDPDAPIKTLFHELLHARTDYRGNTKLLDRLNYTTNEAVTEIMARYICKENGLPVYGTYHEKVNTFKEICDIISNDHIELAKKVFEQPNVLRYNYLKNTIVIYTRYGNLGEEKNKRLKELIERLMVYDKKQR